MDELYAYKVYTVEDAIKYKLPVMSKGYFFNDIDSFYDDWKKSDLVLHKLWKIEDDDNENIHGLINESGYMYDYFYLVKTPDNKLIDWDITSCKLQKGDSISLIERSSNFTVKDINTSGIATQEIDLITWHELLLYFIDSNKNRCCDMIPEVLERPQPPVEELNNYLSFSNLKEEDLQKYNGKKGYFGSRLNRLILHKTFKSKTHYGTVQIEGGLFKNLDTENCYKLFIPEDEE